MESAIMRLSGFGWMVMPSTIARMGLWVFFAKSLQFTFHRASRTVLWRRKKSFRLYSALNLTFSLELNRPVKYNKSFVVCSTLVAIFHWCALKKLSKKVDSYFWGWTFLLALFFTLSLSRFVLFHVPLLTKADLPICLCFYSNSLTNINKRTRKNIKNT